MEGFVLEGGPRPGPQLSVAAHEFLTHYTAAVSEMHVYATPGSIPGLDRLQAECVAKLESMAARYGISEQDLVSSRFAGKHRGERLALSVEKVNTTPYIEPAPTIQIQPELL